jgi:hypothetical protein
MRPGESEYTSEGLADIPDESVVDTESSDGLGLGVEDESDGDHEKDEDYVMELDGGDREEFDSDGEFDLRESGRKPGKAKARHFFPSSLSLGDNLARTNKSQSEATSATRSTMYATTQPSQEIPPPASLPK